MADYQSLLTRAVANLPNSAAADARRAIYERARKALLTQLKTLRPPLPESDIAKEAGALEKAIAAVEAQFASGGTGIEANAPPAPPVETHAPEAEAPAPSRQPPPPRPATPPPRAETSATQPQALPAKPVYAPPRPPQSAPAPRPAATGRPSPERPAAPRFTTARSGAPPSRSPQPPPVSVSPPKPAVAGAAAAPPLASAKTAAAAPPAANLTNVVPSAARDAGAGGAAPQVVLDRAEAFSDASATEPPVHIGRPSAGRIEADGQRPAVPTPPEPKKRSSWPWLALAALLGVVLSVAGAAIVMRQKPQDLAIAPPPEPAPEAAQAPPKIAERAEPAPSPEKPAAPPPPSQAQTSPPAPAASEPQTSPPAPAAGEPPTNPKGSESGTSAGPNGQLGAAPQPAAPQAAASQEAPAAAVLPSAARAAMLVASADNPQKPIVNLGSTVWSLIPAAQGQPATVAVRAEADIPDLKMHATMTLRKNADPTLQATHTIDLKFSFADGAPITGFKDVGLPQMRKLDATAAETLSSVKVKISDVYFLIALARNDQDVARNLDLMQTRAWFDFPLLLNDNRIAKLVFQKSEEGQAMVEKALEAWKQ